MCDNKFYICRHCGNVIGLLYASGVPVECCGEPMEQLIPNTVETSQEKHLPVVEISGDTVDVSIGAVAHPMTPEHNIQWVYLQTENGGQRKCPKPGAAPQVSFALRGDRPIAVFAYCNLHGLWITEL